MNRALSFAALLLALFALGCGGSSTGSSAAVTTTTGGNVTPVVEAVILSADPLAPHSASPVVEDAQNIQVGEMVQFQLVSYDTAGVRHLLPSSGWRTEDLNQEYGVIDPYSGSFTAGQNQMQTSLKVEGLYNGIYYSAYYKVNPNQSRVIGQVVASSTRKGVRGVTIDFFTSSGQIAGTVATSYDGTFRATMPNNAVMFTVDPNTIPSTYWHSFTYGLDSTNSPVVFDAGSISCNATFGNFYSRGGTLLGSTLVVGENFMFLATQPSTLLIPVVPATSTDPSIIVLADRTTYSSKPVSSSCTN